MLKQSFQIEQGVPAWNQTVALSTKWTKPKLFEYLFAFFRRRILSQLKWTNAVLCFHSFSFFHCYVRARATFFFIFFFRLLIALPRHLSLSLSLLCWFSYNFTWLSIRYSVFQTGSFNRNLHVTERPAWANIGHPEGSLPLLPRLTDGNMTLDLFG